MTSEQEYKAFVYIMETFLTREKIKYEKREAKGTKSLYYRIVGKKALYIMRISDHVYDGNKREHWTCLPDFHVYEMSHLKNVQTSLTKLCKR